MNQETIQLLYCVNEEAYDGAMLSLLSVMRHTKRPLRVKILTSLFDLPCGCPVDPRRIAFMRELLDRREDGSTIELTDVTILFEMLFQKNYALGGGFTPYTLLRLLADRVYGGGRVLYLDADTMASGDVGELYDYDLGEGMIGGVPDALGSLFLDPAYINAGVLLMDIDRIKRDGALERARRFLLSHRLFYPDQSAINYSDIPTTLLPQAFNEQIRMRKDTVIRHFCRVFRPLPYPHVDRKKPWQPGALKGRDREVFLSCFEEFLLQRDGRGVN